MLVSGANGGHNRSSYVTHTVIHNAYHMQEKDAIYQNGVISDNTYSELMMANLMR